MQSRLEHGHGYSEDQLNAPIEHPAASEEHGVVEHDLHDNEKRSVLKTVKAKAKKLKDTIKKHTPGGGHDHHEHEDQQQHHDYDQGQHKYHEDEEEDDEEEEDEEREKDPEVHGAPKYDMDSARSFVPGQVGTSVQEGVTKFGGSPTKRADTDQRLKAGEERPFAPVNTPVDVAYPTTTRQEYAPQKASIDASLGTTTNSGHPGVYQDNGAKNAPPPTTDYPPGAGSTMNVAGAHHDPIGAAFAGTHNRGPTAAGTRHDPEIATSHAPAITTDAAGTHHTTGTTAGTHPASNIATSAGSHHAPITSGTPITAASQGTTHPAPVAAETRHDPMIATSHAPTITSHAPTIDISTSAGTQHAPTIPASVAAHHVPASARTHSETMGSNQQGATSQLGGVLENRPIVEEDLHAPGAYNKNYQSKVTDPTGRGGEEAGGVTPAVMQSLGNMSLHDEQQQQRQTIRPTRRQEEEDSFKPTSGHQKERGAVEAGDLDYSTGSRDQFSPEPITSETSSFLQKPEDDQQPEYLDPVTTNTGDQRGEEKLTSEKAAHAKDQMASRLGYGSSPDDGTSRQSPPQQRDQNYTEKLSSVAGTVVGKAAEAKNVVASKLGYGHPGEPGRRTGGASAREGEDTTQTAGSRGGYGSEGRTNIEGQEDKGVSVKEYFVEKFTPGEEDKTLSEVIAGSLHKETHGKEKGDIKGRVAESEQVRRRLGHSSEEKLEDEGVDSGGGNSPGRTMVDQIKGAMTGWFGKGGETQPSKGFHDVKG